MIRTKSELLAYMQEHPGLVLQHCQGIRDHGWWWLRNDGVGPDTIPVHGRAAGALRDSKLVTYRPGKSIWARESNYVLARPAHSTELPCRPSSDNLTKQAESK